jgi:hypothetical protein
MEILKNFPEKQELLSWYKANKGNNVLKVNGHVHTPYSFSSFGSIEQAFEMAKAENISILGINDFYVTDGYRPFYEQALKSQIFPLFNIEFIGLLKEAQDNNIRINDPSNPGRIYFSGKGLNYPFSLKGNSLDALNAVIAESQNQIRAMIEKANQWFEESGANISLNYNNIKKTYAEELVRERHIAKAIRNEVFNKASSEEDRKALFEKIFGGKAVKSAIDNIPALENEIRGNLLKAGGKAFVEEDEKTFLPLNTLISIITEAGGIPCYPVLLDDNAGNITEFERDFEKLYQELSKHKVYCVELIPNRNSHEVLKRFTHFFDNKGFVVLYGTEHNTPDFAPLTVVTRGNVALDSDLLAISYEHSCVVAAHQYLKAKGEEGYSNPSQKEAFIELGKAVVGYFMR